MLRSYLPVYQLSGAGLRLAVTFASSPKLLFHSVSPLFAEAFFSMTLLDAVFPPNVFLLSFFFVFRGCFVRYS